MKNKKKQSENYLDKIPMQKSGMPWTQSEQGFVTLHIENKGFFNRAAQLIFNKPKISHIHLDETGSFVWLQIDGQRDIATIAQKVGEHFGEKAEPIFERAAKYFQILDSYGFVQWKEQER